MKRLILVLLLACIVLAQDVREPATDPEAEYGVEERQALEAEILRISALDAREVGPAEAKRLRDKALTRPDEPPKHPGNITMRQHLLNLSERWEREPQKILDERKARLEARLSQMEVER